MDQAGFLDYLLFAAAIIFSWKMYYAAHPPPGADAPAKPLLSVAPAAPSRNEAEPAEMGATPLDETLRRIAAASGYQSVKTFLDGAKRSYESIIAAFAAGNLGPCSSLLSEVVKTTFEEAIAERKGRHEVASLMFIGFNAAEVVNAAIEAGHAAIDVRFVGQMVSVVRDADGKVVAGDPRQIVEAAEIWTFERDLGTNDPNWRLTATDDDE